MAKTEQQKRLRFAVDCSKDPELYRRIVSAAKRNFRCENPSLGQFALKVLRWYCDERGDQVGNGL